LAQSRAAAVTASLFGHLRTRELNDLTGILDGLLALKRAIMLEWSSLRVAVRVSGWDVEVVQYPPFFDELLGYLDFCWELSQELGDHMPPGLLP